MAVGGIMESRRKSSQLEKGHLTSDWAKLLMTHQHKRKSLFVGVVAINMSCLSAATVWESKEYNHVN